MIDAHEHQLFQQYPITGKALLSTSEVTTPYHIYDGYGLFIGGTADLHTTTELLKSEQLIPLTDDDDKALMGIWICNFNDANLGPHHELQFSIFVSQHPTDPIPAHPLGLLGAMLTRPDLHMLCHGLWNNTPVVVAYNRELLSLNAQLSDSHIELTPERLTFSFRDTQGTAIANGYIEQPCQQSPRANFGLLGQLGISGIMTLVRQPFVEMRIVNPRGVGLTHNAVAHSYTKNSSNIIHHYNANRDHLMVEHATYARLNFKPQFVQFMDGFKFVYLNPD